MDLIKSENLSFAYEGRPVVKDLNFNIKEGDYLCIVGENGSGKSTLMKGLLKLKAPTTGKIVYSNELKETNIGYLPQQTETQKDFPASVYEVVLSGRLNSLKRKFFYSKKDKQVAMENMERLNIANLKNACYRDLSGGQQQRVLLARALCATNKIIFLDEPSSGLDPLVTRDLYAIIDDINKNDGITVVMVSHDIKSALKHGKNILHLKNKQLFFGTVDEYKESHISKEFIGGDF